MSRSPEIQKILDLWRASMALVRDDEDRLELVVGVAAGIEMAGEDDSYPYDEVVECAVQIYRLDPDAVQAALNRGVERVLVQRCIPDEMQGLPTQPAPPGPDKPENDWDELGGDEILALEFPPLNWAVKGILPEGLTLLASRPKIGKSWLVLDIGIAIASSGYVLGEIKPEVGRVLYLALEDGRARLQRRIHRILHGRNDPPALSMLRVVTQTPRASSGGLAKVDEYCERHPDLMLIVIDTLESFRDIGKSDYRSDYAALRGLQQIAIKRRVPIVVVHHDRKADASDPYDTVSGTLGLNGAADTLVMLKRREHSTRLLVRGRDVEDDELELDWLSDTCRWTIIPKPPTHEANDERIRLRERVRELLAQNMSIREIAEILGISKSMAGRFAYELKNDLSPGLSQDNSRVDRSGTDENED